MAGAVLGIAPARAAEAQPTQWIVVAAPAFRSSLDPLIERRRAQGLKVIVIDTTNALTPAEIQQGDGAPLQTRLKDLCAQFHGVSLILLAGAVMATNPEVALQTVVPARPGTTGRMRDQPGDYAYGLPDTNGKPTVAIGRFPAANEPQARDMVRKTLNLEDDTRPGAWRNRLFVFMGDPNGGALGEMMIDPALRLPIPPLDVTLQTQGPVVADKQFIVSGTLPDRLAGAAVRVTLEQPGGEKPAGVDNTGAPSAENCARANNFILTAADAILTGNHFTCALTPPSALPWSNIILRATAATTNESALGVLTLAVGR